MRERSRLLRKNQTEAEIKFWNIVRKRQFHGFSFHRQYAIHSYILDFVCFQKLLVVEFDGIRHVDNKEYDAIRDDFLKSAGFTVLRFWNYELLKNTDLALEEIYQKLIELPDTRRYSVKGTNKLIN
jgi:very-short-patch-repair endonuclease